jgi:pimeloyl-ACP methyl ester carboxylesterase
MRSLFNFGKSFVIVGLLLSATSAMAPDRKPPAVKNVVLVHGAFADGSSWAKVIPLLESKGFHVSAVGNPLTSYADDLAATKRQIAVQDGPVILVGHSYAGVVITEAGADPKVVGLVYVAAFAPDANQSINMISASYPKPPGLAKITPLSDGFIMLSPDGIANDFAQDLTPAEKAVISAAQPQTAGSIFDAKPATAAWHAKPAWYIVAANDRMIAPEQEKTMAKQINATTTVLPSSHVVMLSQPASVAKVIADAAGQSLAAKR